MTAPKTLLHSIAAGHFGRRLLVLVTLTVLVLARPTLAHHSFAMYDSEKLLQLEGTVKEFQWTNPHAIVWVTGSTQPNQPPELWTVELPTSPGNLGRMGWKRNSLAPGDHVVIEINPLRDGRRGGSFKKATLTSTGVVLVANVRDEPPSTGAGGAHTEDDHDHDEGHDHEEKSSCSLRAAPESRDPLRLWLLVGCLAGCGARRRRYGAVD
jgi:Family of unknown function (DUF6152)